MTSAPAILLVGGERDKERAKAALQAAGITNVIAIREGADYEYDLQPDLVVVTDGQFEKWISDVHRQPALTDLPVVAWLTEGDDPSAVLAAGANDVLDAGSPSAVIATRIGNMVRGFEAEREARQSLSLQAATPEIEELIATGADSTDTIRQALEVAARALDFEGAAIIAYQEFSEASVVVAGTDDRTSAIGWEYPGLRAALTSGNAVFVADTAAEPIASELADALDEKGMRAIAAFPIWWKSRALGGLLFRSSLPGHGGLSKSRMAFSRWCATRLAPLLKGGELLPKPGESTQRISRARYESERRRRTIESLKAHFEASADGVCVIDRDGHIIFLNGVAERITGFAGGGLQGEPLFELVPEEQHELLSHAIWTVLNGENLESFDLDLSTTSGQPVRVSVSTSTVLSKSGAIILSFREVTTERALENELRKTKEFLEKLIDSTVDGIVAADMRGLVILFNQGAERIFGYRTEEVVGILPVWKLYPPGVSTQVMSALRSESQGGVGRLEQVRREILEKGGDVVPVNMTASIIFEGEQEVASVGIFSDLRERLRIEQSLAHAQEKLEVSEKRALVAQLAGAAAHELNQPLTSIMGYAELVQRTSEEGAPHVRAVEVILREAERMAEIVRKIGRITKFETKDYVGSASIIDLDRSSATGDAPAVDAGQVKSPMYDDSEETNMWERPDGKPESLPVDEPTEPAINLGRRIQLDPSEPPLPAKLTSLDDLEGDD